MKSPRIVHAGCKPEWETREQRKASRMTTDAAAERAGCPSALFLRVAKKLGIQADETRQLYSKRTDKVYYLWLPETVDRIARSDVMSATRASAERRAPATAKAVATKRANAIAWAKSLPPAELPSLSKDDLTRLAVQHYNGRQRPDSDRSASVADSPAFLERITVNYIRHTLTNYEARLFAARGRVGVDDAKNTIRSRILRAIAEAYPWLTDECEQQDAPPYRAPEP